MSLAQIAAANTGLSADLAHAYHMLEAIGVPSWVPGWRCSPAHKTQ